MKARVGRVVLSVAAVGVMVLSAAGCSSPRPAPTSASGGMSRSSSAAVDTVAFGQSHRFANGVSLTLDPLRIYQRAVGNSRDTLLQIHVTVVNGTTNPYPMTGPHTVDLAATVNGQPAATQAVNDPPEVVAPSGTLLPGQTQSFDSLYALPPQPADLVITVTDRAAEPQVVLYRGQTPNGTTVTVRPPAATVSPPPPTTRPRTATTTVKLPPTRSEAPVQNADSGLGCGERAMAAGQFNPACSEYQGYLDPGGSGRGPTSGDQQHQVGCEQGYIPADEC